MNPPKPRPRNVEEVVELEGGIVLRDYEAEKLEQLKKIYSELWWIAIAAMFTLIVLASGFRDLKIELQKVARDPVHVVIVNSEKEAERK